MLFGKKIISILIFCSSTFFSKNEIEYQQILSELSQEKYFLYQDIIINNVTIFHGVGPNCSQRYELLKPIFNQFQSPLKILDLGANNGFFSFKISHDYSSCCVMMDLSDRLYKLCTLNDEIKNIVYLKHEINVSSLKVLAANEKFDVILAFNILHHLDNVIEVLDLLFSIADMVIIETPTNNDPRVKDKPNILVINQYLEEKSNKYFLGKILRSEPKQFDHVEQIIYQQDLQSQMRYCNEVYGFLYACTIKNDILEKPLLTIDTFNSLNGVYSTIF